MEVKMTSLFPFSALLNKTTTWSPLQCGERHHFEFVIGSGFQYCLFYCSLWASLVAERLKHLPAMWETLVRSLDWEDPLEKELAIHSSIVAWRIPWTEEPNRLQSMQRVGHD